jgi:hypothetical protein
MRGIRQSRPVALLPVVAVGGALALAGCGSTDDVSTALDNAQTEANKQINKAQKELNGEISPEAQKKLNEAQDKANKAINDAGY